MTRTTIAAAACLSLALACVGVIDGILSPSDDDFGGVVSQFVNCSQPATDVDVILLRRLMNAEYLNMVSDLLGDVSALNLDFVFELIIVEYLFRNKAAEQ